jgi:hypothetical protein
MLICEQNIRFLAHKALADTGIKLDCVATNILGKSGLAMLDALCQGATDPDVLAELAQRKLKILALREALEGRFEPHHALVIGPILAHLDFLDEHIAAFLTGAESRGAALPVGGWSWWLPCGACVVGCTRAAQCYGWRRSARDIRSVC